MSTILFPAPIFGPVHSRRLGISLGINLLPADRKICSFDCLYCECGFNQKTSNKIVMPTRSEVSAALEAKLQEMTGEGQLPDVITYAGNGEPTLHPEFAEIIDDTIALRNTYAPKAKVAVLTNASRFGDEKVRAALRLVDDCIAKLDSGLESTVLKLDRPNYKYDIDKTIEQIAMMGDNLAVQTMFVRWQENGQTVDNMSDTDVLPWLEALRRINPPRVMIYTIDRDTPLHSMSKATHEELDALAARAREIVKNVSISY
jgi:wyosine [tRNA(Phe)-imidazoG37] synthetase (radical SAM superfamily)